MIAFIAIIAVAVFIWLKYKTDKRRTDRINRLAEKQEELIEMLRAKEKDAKKDGD